MGTKIKNVYIVHHSHTDIGYTDLQEQVVFNQVNNIRKTVSVLKKGYEENSSIKDFKWNCETYYCVEQFLKDANEQEKEDFFELVKKGNIGISANYLNFTDLVDCEMADYKAAEMQKIFTIQGCPVKTAMNADVNGISLGMRDVLIKNGIEFLFMNIHTHHGMYPLYQNQKPFFWENEKGEKLLVWSGEHYHLGNRLGLAYSQNVSSTADMEIPEASVETLFKSLSDSISEYEESGYPYDFYIASVSGVFSDNAPANPAILAMVNTFNKCHGGEVKLQMVTLQELYRLISEQTADVPVYRGTMNDWWGNGVGSTPYAVKHYKEALRLAHMADRLEEKSGFHDEKLAEIARDNALLYAEHTWGHSATISNPYDTLVTNLDIRKNAYASKTHEVSAMRKMGQFHRLGDILRYYNLKGKVKAVSVSCKKGVFPVEFYVETSSMKAVKVTDLETGEVMKTQLSAHPRGVLVSFVSEFDPMEEKLFSYEEQPVWEQKLYSRTAWVGVESVRDIVNDYDKESYKLPHGLENRWFHIGYEIGKGITSFYNKKSSTEMLKDGLERFFTPIYERTQIRKGIGAERSVLGRNIRGLHAKQYQGALMDVKTLDHDPVFDKVELVFEMEGTYHSSVVIRIYRQLPRIDFTYRIAKTLNEEIESVYLPLSLNLPGSSLYINNGGVGMRPGIDQLPGSNMEYYIADQGVLYQGEKESLLINTLDTPLIYMGEMKHHKIVLCDNSEKNNHRPVYSWIMNNTWETNFKMDLSGFGEFAYSLELTEGGSPEENLDQLKEKDMGIAVFIIE